MLRIPLSDSIIDGSRILSRAALASLPEPIVTPRHPTLSGSKVICHIGVGGFHRAHQALYVQQVNDKAGKEAADNWTIVGVGVLKKDQILKTILKKQDYLYAVLSQSAKTETVTIVNSISNFLLLDDGKAELINFLGKPEVKILSLTITEAGYCQNEQGHLDIDFEDVQNDIRTINQPRTALGLIIAALVHRRTHNVHPFTVMSCDNLQENGHMTKRLVLEMAGKIDPELGVWIGENVAFPNSMVDRITPVTETKHVAYLQKKYGIHDEWPVVCEDFRQWVLEDKFCNDRPPYEEVGVEIVSDVRSYELMKLRLLNGSHSALAYLASLAGFAFVHEAMASDVIRSYVLKFMEEIGRSLQPIEGVDYQQYKFTLLSRFMNPKIGDTIERLCIDGSSKFANFLQDAVVQLAPGQPKLPALEMALAGWIRYLADFTDRVDAVRDRRAATLVPIAYELKQMATGGEIDAKRFLQKSLPELIKFKDFVRRVGEAFQQLCQHEVLKVVHDWA